MATLLSAEEYRRTKIALADRAVLLANRGEDVGLVVVRHQAAGALVAQGAVANMLDEQGTPVEADATLNPLGFIADPVTVRDMASRIDEKWRFDRLVAGLVVDSMLAAESVAIATRPRTGYVRYVGPSCCSRCAILAGKFYRWNSGFLRHPRCRCVHIPTTDPRSDYRQDPMTLVREGRVTGLSKADMQALADGADLNQLVNIHRGGLELVSFGPGRTVSVSREGITRHGLANRRNTGRNMRARLTPDSIYRVAESRERAIEMLRLHGYVTGGTKRAATGRVATGKPAAAPTKPPLAAAGGRGGGSNPPPRASLGAFADPPDPNDKAATAAYWKARQDALGINANGETLTPDEIRFVERFHGRHGTIAQWLKADRSHRRKTNDFEWVELAAQIELKSPKDRYRTIANAIRADTPWKQHFIIDLGHRPLTQTLRWQLEKYNERNPEHAISSLWVLSEDGAALNEIRLR